MSVIGPRPGLWKGSKGNYPTLAKLAKKLPVFPNIDNQRSMLHIENFCEFLCQIMLVNCWSEKAIVLIPQNEEWVRTSNMVKIIADFYNKNIVVPFEKLYNICITILCCWRKRKLVL